MEKEKKEQKIKKITIDLPKIQTKPTPKSGSSKQNFQCRFIGDLSPQIKNLRKLFFQYRSNARILQSSPYYINNTKNRQKFVEIITTRRFDLSQQVLLQIEQKYGWKQPCEKPHALPIAEKKQIRVKLHYEGKVYCLKVYCRTSLELTTKLTAQLAKVMFSLKNTFKKCDILLCFQTIQQNHEIDFILSNPNLEISFLSQLSLRPVFNSKPIGQGKKVALKDFKFIKCLGNGGFSTVFLVRGNHDNKYYAMKLISKDFIVDSQREGIVENERYILGEFNFPLITQLEFAFQTKNHFALVIQYCPGGELFYQLKKVKKMKEAEAKFYFLQILAGLDYIHCKNIVYRDLKPQNLLIGIDGHVKIADFGLSKPISDKKKLSHSFCGSPEYMAPEMLQKAGHNYLLDYYCLGALLYELVIGLPPYYSLNQQEIYQSIISEELSFPTHVDLSDELKNLLRGLLEKNAKKRLGCLFGIKEILLHPWVGKVKQKSIQNKELEPPFLPNLEAFNFDIADIKTDQQAISRKIQEDIICGDQFQTFFNDDFYFENPVFRQKMSEINKSIETSKPKRKKLLKKSRSVQQSMNMTNRKKFQNKPVVVPSQKTLKPLKLGVKNQTCRLLRKVKSSKNFNITTLRK